VLRVLALTAVVGTFASPAASAQSSPSTPSSPSGGSGGSAGSGPALALVSQSASTPVGGTLTLLVQTSGPVDGLRLTLTVHDRLLSRSAFDATVTSENPSFPTTRALLRRPLDQYPPDAFGVRRVDVDVTNDLNVRTSGNGVYPMEVQLRDANDATLAGFVTYAVVTDPNAPVKPLAVAWVWPFAATPAFRPDGTADPAVVAQLGTNGRLGRQAAAIGADTDVPLTIAPSPETLASWASLSTGDVDLAVGAEALRTAPQHHQVLSGPFVPLDLPTLVAGGFTSVVTTELQSGADTLQTFFGTDFNPNPSTAMPGPLDAGSLDILRTAARSRLVVDGSALAPGAGRFTPSRPALLGPSAGTRVLATDTGVERHLSGREPPVVRAARLLAELTVIAGEQPSITRGVAIMNPDNWDPSPHFVDAVLDGLRGNPLLRPVTTDTLFAETPLATDDTNGNDLVRTLAPVDVHRPGVSVSKYYDALQARQGIADLFGSADARVARADRSLLTVLAADWENAAGRARARELLTAIGQSGRDFLTHIQVPLKSTITLTSSNAQIPLTFRNAADRAVKIHVALQSDKLLFPDGSGRDVRLEPGKNETVRIAVETRSSGTYPMVMTVTTAGGLPISTSEVTVRSSFVSGVGIFLTVGAIAFLALWWGWDIRRRRLRRRTAA
jgi:hypothetical protein